MIYASEISFDMILRAVADEALVSPASIVLPGAKGRHPVTAARQRTLMLARRLIPSLSYSQLGDLLGGREPADLYPMAERGERRYRDDPVERLIVRRVLDTLGVAELPPSAVGGSRRHALVRKIERLRRDLREAEAKLQQLHGAA